MGKTAELDRHATLFRVLGNPTRLGIVLRLVQDGEICACDFTEYFGVTQPTISGHLRALRDAGMVRTRRQGTQICYSVEPAAVQELRTAVAALGLPVA